MDKYYSDSTYKVEAMRISNNFFSLKCDNNNSDYVVVFLNDLSRLPYEELIHWKGYNIAPDARMALSYSYYNTMVLGNWSHGAETLDLFFKERFAEYVKKWNCKFKWDLFKPLNDIQKHVFKGLHIPTTENISTFINQIEGLALILIDSLNDRELSKNITIEKEDKSIAKFQKHLAQHNCPSTEIIEFFRNLQSLRSGITKAHRFSKNNKDAIKAMKHFEIEADLSNCIKSSERLFMDSIYTLNTLMIHFNL